MRLEEWVLDGMQVVWANLMLACMYEQLDQCFHGLGSFLFGSMIMTFFFKHVISLRLLGVMVEEIG